MSKKVSYNEIQDSTIDWGMDEATGLPFSGQSVQNFLRKHTQMAVDNREDKLAAVAWDPATMSHLTFNSIAKYEEWLNTGDNSLAKQIIPFQIAGRQKRIRIATLDGSTTFYYTTENTTAEITVSILVQSKEIADVVWEDEQQDTFVTVAIDRGNSGRWTDIVSNKRVPYGENYTVDVRNYLAAGQNRVRFTAIDEAGEKQESVTFYANLTSMYLRPTEFAWYIPFIEGQPFSLGGMYIGGNLSKTLKIRVTDEVNYVAEYEENIGTATYTNVAYYFNNLKFPDAGTGVYGVELWLEAEGVQSTHLKYNIMCVRAEEQQTAQLVAISNIPAKVKNYDTNILFSYACYNKGLSEATPNVLVQSIINNQPTTIVDETLTVATGVEHNFVQALEIETNESNLNLSAYMTYGNEQEAYYTIDNSLAFPPVSNGLAIYVNPVNRSNAQENKQYIINEYNGEAALATWSNVAFIDGMDGWTTDGDGRKCLLIPATCSVEIPYTPLLDAVKTRSLEFAYKVTNTADFTEDILTIASSAASNFIGVKIKPTNVLLHSKLNYTDDIKQSYNTKDEEFVHVFITLVQNYKQIANLAQIYVNGVKACSFEWSSGDNFDTSATVKIGSNTADIDLYKLRVYNTGFEWPAVVQNYISCLPDSESKKAAYERINSVTFGGVIDYDKVVNGGFNYFLLRLPEGAKLPSALSKVSVKGCRLFVDIKQKPDFVINGTYEDVETEGQGTTAMNYFRWNLRWKTDSVRITAKKNFASSMHSHKMGATALFNDLNRQIVGPNEADGRVAVEQFAAYGFIEIPIEGAAGQYIYEPIGLYTIGQDKGDKPTFGYNHPDYKKTLIHLEGTDHNPKGVGMDYPWGKLSVVTNSDGDANLGVLKTDGTVAAAWEIGACGSAETDAERLAYLKQEFFPAYDCDYRNTSMILGLDGGTVEDANAVASQLRGMDAGNGFTVGDCLIWFNGEYKTYYYDVVEEKYLPDGIHLLEDLGITEESLEGLTVEEKNATICALRKERYRAEMENYWHLRDSLFHYCFIVLFAATDNFKKNTYPYKFGTLESGSRWRWRQDDLDTLFDINNQGLANKIYSLMNGDKSGITHLFRGNNSFHWLNIQQYYDTEIRSMMREIMTAMANLCPTGYGESLIEKCIGCIRYYFRDKAQGYLPASAYNIDAEWTYEDAWAAMVKGQYDSPGVHPLGQSLGNHDEAERAWVELRFLFMASMYGFGAFGVGNDQDTSTGQIAFRPAQGENVFNLTPIVNMNPTILVGDSDSKSANGRVNAGDTATIAVSTDGDTSIYIQGVDYLSDIGDFSKIKLYAENPALSVRSKRLKKLKVGDEVAGNPELSTLTINDCPSLMEVDARNIPKLAGSVSLKACPRLQKALFGGSSASEILLPDGCKITEFELPDTLQNLSLVGLPILSEEGLKYNTLNALTYLRVEGNPNLDGYALMKVALTGETTSLKNIRIIGFDYYGDATDIDLLAIFAEGGFYGIDENGNADNSIIPFLEGTLHVNGSVYEDTAKIVSDLYAGRITLDIQGGYYIRFADQAVLDVLLAKGVGDGIGITTADAEAVTSISTWFNRNTEIVSFDEFEKFIGVTSLSGSDNATNAVSSGAFYGCTGLTSITFPANLQEIKGGAFINTENLAITINIPSLRTLGHNVFKSSGILAVENLGTITTVGISGTTNWGGEGLFYKCPNLRYVKLPSTTESIAAYTFYSCTVLDTLICEATTPPTLGNSALSNTPIASGTGYIYVPDAAVDAYKEATNWSQFSDVIKPISEYTE
ncbi:MAG: leucine-rich repeat protein [Alistipes sp.]|nr:leucine-rich repeat protein [Alistipes sp.]MBQ6862273.1 leucine-rich repeat protein [Alistipes sp.]